MEEKERKKGKYILLFQESFRGAHRSLQSSAGANRAWPAWLWFVG